MDDYKDLIEILREMSRFFIRNEASSMSVSDEMITSMNAEAVKDAADAIEQLAKERDAAIADLKNIRACKSCINLSQHIDEEPCNSCLLYVRGRNTNNFEWRGVMEDNDEID